MVNRNLLRQFGVDADVDEQIQTAFEEDLQHWLQGQNTNYEVNKIVEGTVLDIRGDDVMIDIGYKSEGVIKIEEWREEGSDQVAPPKPGDKVQVLLETVE